jgi:hypothetical protein
MSVVVVPAAGAAQSSEGTDSVPLSSASSLLAVPGEFLVEADQSVLFRIAHLNPESLGFGIYRITDPSPGTPAARAAQLSADLGVLVEPNVYSQLLATNPEPDASLQWSHENLGQDGGVVDADIDALEAWDASTGSGTIIAILDTGADLDHPDVEANLWVNTGEIAGNGIDDDANGYVDDVNGWDFVAGDNDPSDSAGASTGHGTATAAVAAAPITGQGIAGVAPDATIMVLRVCGITGCLDSNVIEALDYVVANGGDIANLSFGKDGPRPSGLEAAVSDAIAAGVVVVVAAGNGGLDFVGDNNDSAPMWPANFEFAGLLSVGATDRADGLASFSNFGQTSVNTAAPGVDIPTAVPDDDWADWDGTSFAAPMVAGVAALALSSDACATPARVDSLITNRGDVIPALAGKTVAGRRLNALQTIWSGAVADDVVAGSFPLAVTFPTAAGGTLWDFDDGETVVAARPHHVFERGVYTVSNDAGSAQYEVAAGVTFTDTCTNGFRTEITWLSALGITSGCAAGLFCPDDALTRAQMATFLATALKLPASPVDYFDDDGGSIHEASINRLAHAGIASGCATRLFCPGASVTRAQTATFFANGFGLSGGSNAFSDDNGSVHEANINALAASGITSGCAAGLFCPNDPISRDQMAAFFFRGRDLLPG